MEKQQDPTYCKSY